MSRRRATAGAVILTLSLAALLAAYALLARRGYHRAAIYGSAGVLAALVDDWQRNDRPTGGALTNLLAGFGTYKPFVFTNTIRIAGTNYHCVFALRNAAFASQGLLAITPEKVVIWTGEDGSEVVDVARRR